MAAKRRINAACIPILVLYAGCGRIGSVSAPSLVAQAATVEERVRRCLCAIIDDVAELAGEYPELDGFSPGELKLRLAPRPNCQWAMTFSYEHNFQHASGKLQGEGPTFEEGGCYLGVEFRKIDALDQRKATYVCRPLGLQVFRSCLVSQAGSQDLAERFRRIVHNRIQELKEGGT